MAARQVCAHWFASMSQLDWEVLQTGLKLPQNPHPNLQILDAGVGRGPRVGFRGDILQSQASCLSTALDLGELLQSPSLQNGDK